MNQKDNMIEVGALWEHTSGGGEVYFSGKFGGARLLMFTNDKRGNDRAPDYRLFVAPSRKKEEQAEQAGVEEQPEQKAFTPPPTRPSKDGAMDYEEVPF